MANNSKEDPKTAPQSDRWYNLTLGPSFKEDSSNKYCTLRYEFKPASIDKTKPGSLHKNKENRVSVEFHNNQLGKPKVTFEGSSEDYKENDAVLFFDGETFRLERLHRAVKQLRHLRKGESGSSAVAAAAAAAASLAVEPKLSPVWKGAKPMHMGRSSLPAMPVEVERIHVGEPENPVTDKFLKRKSTMVQSPPLQENKVTYREEDRLKKIFHDQLDFPPLNPGLPPPSIGAKPAGKGIVADPFDQPHVSTGSPAPKNDEAEDHQDIDIDDIFGAGTPEDENAAEQKVDVGVDINEPRQNDTDDEIADVDDSGDEAHKGRNAAEALRARVNAEERDEQTSSSSSSSGSGSSGSGSGSGSSSSSDSEGSDDDSVNSI